MSVLRKVLLAMSTSTFLREQATRRAFVRRSVSAFMPGETVEEALAAAATLKPQRINTILTRLDKVKAAGLDAQISVKPTQLGHDLDAAQAQRNLDRICEKAERLGNVPVWIDMENSPYVDPTITMFRTSRERYKGVGLAMQAYLYRTAKDLEALIPLGPAIRIVKGAYLEPPEIAYPKKSDVDQNFYTLCTRLLADDALKAGSLLHIATHDIALADRLGAFIDERKIQTSAYEYAMLYGIQRGQQQRLAQSGKRTRVLISYGEYWYPWYMRRLAERPANVTFVLKNLFGS
jgi:proline dehydrogenase